jgi:hypothetical protein
MRGHEETREHCPWAILNGRHLSATLPFVAHCNCIGFLYGARLGYRPHLPLSTKRAFSCVGGSCCRIVYNIIIYLLINLEVLNSLIYPLHDSSLYLAGWGAWSPRGAANTSRLILLSLLLRLPLGFAPATVRLFQFAIPGGRMSALFFRSIPMANSIRAIIEQV